MDVFVQRLRQRTAELGLTNVEVSRRLGLNDRTYAHYAAGRREPNLQIVVRIAKTLQTSPNFLLGFTFKPEKELSERERLAEQAGTIVYALGEERARQAVQILRVLENFTPKNQ